MLNNHEFISLAHLGATKKIIQTASCMPYSMPRNKK